MSTIGGLGAGALGGGDVDMRLQGLGDAEPGGAAGPLEDQPPVATRSPDRLASVNMSATALQAQLMAKLQERSEAGQPPPPAPVGLLPSITDSTTRVVTRDPSDANSPYSYTELEEATNAVIDNYKSGKVDAALAKLTPEQQAQFKAVVKELPLYADVLTLQKMLLGGRLPGSADIRGGQDLLGNLAELATGDVAGGIDRGRLLAEVLREVADPSCLSQKAKGTCAATSVAIVLASQRPAEYVRLVRSLASPEGEAALQNGMKIHREDDWASATDVSGGKFRTTSGRLLFPAFMEYANGLLDYDNTAGAHELLDTEFRKGLYQFETTKLLRAVTGDSYVTKKTFDFNRDKAMEEIEALTDRGEMVPAGIWWRQTTDASGKAKMTGHEIVVTAVRDGKVHIINPWGQEEALDLEDFKQRLKGYSARI